MKRDKLYRVTGVVRFTTAFHLGSGQAGDQISDMGVLKDPRGNPLLPGSTLKGKCRATAERLAPSLSLKACMLDTALSGIDCVSDERTFKEKHGDPRKTLREKLEANSASAEEWLRGNTCDVCWLFGSPLRASRIFFADGELLAESWSGVVETRDGVVLNRDSGTAVEGLKYDFEAIPARTAFRVAIQVEDPTKEQLALVGATLSEWQLGFQLGGFTSRGLGWAILEDVVVGSVDFQNGDQVRDYLLKRKLTMQAGLGDFEKALVSTLG